MKKAAMKSIKKIAYIPSVKAIKKAMKKKTC